MNRLIRCLEISRRLPKRKFTVREFSQAYEVSTRTIQRDLNALMQAGFPVRYICGQSGGYWEADK